MLILAVDDETLMLNMLVETLKNVFSDERYVVMGFDDGKEALEYVSSSEESLPYAFLDIRLRGMLGIELAKEIKEIRSETRIIFCSAYTEYALDAFSVHAVGYLLKPITKAKIQETLDQIDMMLNRDPEPERQKLVVQTLKTPTTTDEIYRQGGRRFVQSGNYGVTQSSVQNSTFFPSRIRLVVRTAHILPHMEQV